MGSSSQRDIRFQLLGAVDLKGPEGTEPSSVLGRPKLVGLLSVLAAAAPRGFQRRDTLIGLFWGELDQSRARGALRQSLYYLRQFLGESVIVARGDEEVGLAEERVWSDVAAFEDALEQGDWEEALDLYRGDLLQGFFVAGAPEFEHWLDRRREELRERARVAALELARRTEADGDVAGAARWVRTALRSAPFDEDLVRRAIQLLDRVGDRAGAVREYEAFASRLGEELEVEPAPETQALIEAVRSRVGVEPAKSAVQPARTHPASPPKAGAPAAAVPPAEPAADFGDHSAKRRVWSPPFRLGLLVGAALVVGLVIVWAFGSGGGAGVVLNPERVVVAVFDNQTGDPELDPLGRMAADWVTQGLDQIEVVDVVPSTKGLVPRPDFSAPGVAGPADVRALAESTGAGTVVAGAYYRSGDTIEFQAQVVDARGGQLLSAVAPVGGPRHAPGAIVETLRQRVVGTVAAVFDSRVASSVSGGQPPSLEAYKAYLEGHRAFAFRNAMREALSFFYRAVELDSAFLDPRFYLVFAHRNLGEWQAADSQAQLLVPHRPRMNAYQRSTLDWQLAEFRGDRTAALEAARARGGSLDRGVVALKANHPHEAVDALSNTSDVAEWYFHFLTLMEAYHILGDYWRELREARSGREKYPQRFRMLDAEVRALAALGRTDEVMQRLDESLLLPPEDGLLAGHVMGNAAAELRAHGLRAASFEAGERAVEWYRSRPAEEAATGRHRFDLALAYYMMERWDEARMLFEELALEAPRNVNVEGFLGVLAARRGDREEALRISENLSGMAAPGDFGRDVYWQVCIAAQLGERERATVLLREAYARGRAFTVLLHRDMDLEPLRDYPPYQKFIEAKG